MTERLQCKVHRLVVIEGWYFVDGDPNARPLCRTCKLNLERSGHQLVGALLEGQPALRVTIRDPDRADRLAAEWADR